MVTARLGAVGTATFALALAGVFHASGQTGPAATTAPDALAALAPLIGRWTGTSDGQPGKGTVERTYARALGSRFIRVTNRTTYPPQDKNPKAKRMKTRAGSATTARASGWCSGSFTSRAS